MPITSPIEIVATATIAIGETSVRRFSRPKAGGSWRCSPSECASRVKPDIDVVAAARQDERTGESDVHDERVADQVGDVRARRASTMPASGAFSHSSPSAVRPFSTGKAESPTAATAAVRRTTSPIAEKRLRGSVRPGSRASSARLATVSSPVYASIASGSANARSSQVGETPRSVPCVSASGETSSAAPSSTSRSCVARSSPATTRPAVWSCERRTSRTAAIARITVTATTMSHGESRSASTPSAVPR